MLRIIVVFAILLSPVAAFPQQQAVWRLADRPSLSIGSVDGDERYTFEDISGVLVLRDGRIAVAERRAARIRVYGQDGRHIADWGRAGEGPGEYQYIRTIAHYRGDSIAVHDMALRRITILDSQGRFGRSFILKLQDTRTPGAIPSQSCCMFVGAFSNGTFVAAKPASIPTRPGAQRFSQQAFYSVSADGARVDSIGSWPSELYAYDPAAPNKVRGAHFSPRMSYTISHDRLFLGNGSTWAITVFAPSGSSVRAVGAIEQNRPLEPVTREMRRQFEERVRENYNRNPQMYEGPVEMYLAGQFASTLPVYTRLSTDSEGNLWVYQPPSDVRGGQPVRFDIFGRDNRHLATLTARGRWFPSAITANAMVFIEPDVDGVQYIRVYAIQRR